jgi:hypothetical protein
MFSLTGAVAELLVVLELLAAAEPDVGVVCVTLGLIGIFLPMPALRRGLLNR